MDSDRFPPVIMFRFEDKAVYVKPAHTYEQALDSAQREFAQELSQISRNRITFTVDIKMKKDKRCAVRISPDAWAATVAQLRSGSIVDIQVKPPRQVAAEAPPRYEEIPKTSKSRQTHPSDSPQKAGKSWWGLWLVEPECSHTKQASKTTPPRKLTKSG